MSLYDDMVAEEDAWAEDPAMLAELADSQAQNYPAFGSRARAVGQGLAFDSADEIEAGVRSLFSDRSYDDIVTQIRGENEAYATENPAENFAIQGMSGFVPVLGWANKASKAGKLVKHGMDKINRSNVADTLSKSNIAKSGGEGALTGYGMTEGDDSFGDQAQSVLLGLGLGGGMGAGATGVQKAIGNTIRKPKYQAGRIMQKSLGDDTPETLAARVNEMGPEAILGDATPELQSDMQALGNMTGTRNMVQLPLEARQMSQPDRLGNIVEETTGQKATSFDEIERLKAERRQYGRDAYDDLSRQTLVPTEAMTDWLETADGKRLWKKALRNYEQRTGQPIPEGADMTGNVGMWDLVTRGAKDKIAVASRKGAKSTADLDFRTGQIIDEVDKATGGALDKVRTGYAAKSAPIDAVQDGEKFMQMSLPEFKRTIDGMTEEQRRSMLVGMTETLMGKLEKSPETANNAWNLIKTKSLKGKLTAILGEERTTQYIKRMQDELEQTNTYNMTSRNRNSITGALAEKQRSMGGSGLVDAGVSTLTGQHVEGARQLVRAATNGRKELDPRLAREIAEVLLSKGPDVEQALNDILRQGEIAPNLIPNITRGLIASIPETKY